MSGPYALLVSYDGTEYAGWQVQPDRATVQGVLQNTLARLHGVAAVSIVGAGRTDAGVHALGQVASYDPPTARDPGLLLNALFHTLPQDIRVLDVRETPAGFHACRSAVGKVYRYRIVNRPFVLPFEVRWTWHVRCPLDVEAMQRAAADLVGTHDFAGFANAGGQSRTTVRTLRRLDVRSLDGGLLEVEAEADGFLYKMVRNMTGLLVAIGRGRRPASDAAVVLAARARVESGMTAPPQGLCLVRALYDDSVYAP